MRYLRNPPASETLNLTRRDWTRTVFLRGDDEDYTMTTRARLLERIRVTLAGRAAEELVLGDATTYSVKDLRVRRPTN